MELKLQGNKIFAPIIKKWVLLSPEEKLRQEFICRLINNYGYSIDQLGQDVEIRKRFKADIAIWKSKAEKEKKLIPSIIITVECKAEHIKIKEDDYLLGYNFASLINANFFIATNLKETKIFHVLKNNIPQKLEKLNDIPTASILTDNNKIQKYIEQTRKFTRDEFTKLLFKCHNIIRNNDKLSPEAAFDEISKILFMKIMYERKPTEELKFSYERFSNMEKDYEENVRPELKNHGPAFDKDFMQYLFGKTKEAFKNDELFDPNEQIKIKRNSFEMIVKELEQFNLSDTSDDVKGIAFEEFLGKTFRGDLGQFFTPRTIVDYMVDVLDPQEGEKICDPCCGSGGFLIKAFEYIRDKIDNDIKHVKDKIRKQYFNADYETLLSNKQSAVDKKVQNLFDKLHQEFNLNNTKSRYFYLSQKCIFGTDANPRMARTAKMNMIMHGDGHGGVHHHDGLLNINGIFEERFDVIFTNPPFGARVEKSQRITKLDIPMTEKIQHFKSLYKNYEEVVVNPLINWANANEGQGTPILETFIVGEKSGLTEVLFIERCLNLLKPGGRMGIVLPEGVLNTPKLQRIRDFVESKSKIIKITSIPQDVFIASGATVKPSLLFFKKFDRQEEEEYHEIKNNAEKIAKENYSSEIEKIENRLKTKGLSKDEKKELKTKLKQIFQQIEEDVKQEIKQKFDYEIPIIEVDDAGITTTGAASDNNQLIPAAKEFKKYRSKNKLWVNNSLKIDYVISNGTFKRKINSEDAETFYEH
jgi:type I restriction enzyme M protein